MKRFRSHKGFAASEIVAVCLCAAMIAAAVLPVFVRARDENDARAKCKTNLNAMGLGLAQYVQDYDYQYPRRTATWASELLQPYVRYLSVCTCPSVEEPEGHGPFDYGLNSDTVGVNVSDFTRSAQTVALFESVPKFKGHEAIGKLSSGDRPVLDRHQGGANFGFADGHSKWLLKTVPLESAIVTFRVTLAPSNKKH